MNRAKTVESWGCDEAPADEDRTMTDEELVVVWDGTRSGPVGSKSANRHLLFWEPAYAEEDDDPAPRVVVRQPSSPRLDTTQHQAEVLAAMGASWTRPCTIVRRIGRSHYSVNRTLHSLVKAGAVERRNEAPLFSRGVLWYRRVNESSR